MSPALLERLRKSAGILRNTAHADPQAPCTCVPADPYAWCARHGETPEISRGRREVALFVGGDQCLLRIDSSPDAPADQVARAIVDLARDVLELLDEMGGGS